jgi:hypothetical protein
MPGRKKYRYQKTIGYQKIEKRSTQSSHQKPVKVYSSFEYSIEMGHQSSLKAQAKAPQASLISNSLQVRRFWIDEFGFQGSLPTVLKPSKGDGLDWLPVYLIAQDEVHPEHWSCINSRSNDAGTKK